ncbi:LINE-1 retrotransposable element ORF2 protein [Zancudomyces culisetae]|uniref:LINE-1 retrotransposable element ORF2 protein n=1 Tax=Zancudomyces culisetae TaxID=1213189 RepID=A0A1R1PP39_ZANCU|nr:LINE-1 retrotransposable element ORF2 protein [Zancudomyces culisetae]|eukprot:OMH82745.1 LINE-1 retrotransposable element ORF2 protein [Zancudomyces culisetae]
MVSRIFDKEEIPTKWSTSIVVPVPKKGDLTDPNNYRGISLIPTMVKLVAKIVATRLNKEDNRVKLLAKEQAGFCSREECVACATTLYEIVRRRKLNKQETWIAFIDFAKAYDKVSQEALLTKLNAAGIRKNYLKLIKGLYKAPKMCVRVGGELSPVVNYDCGVRQGCPLSPFLFDVYINDIFNNIKGVTVPGLPNVDRLLPTRVPGLLFADDLVVLAETPEDMEISLNIISEWDEKFEMSVNAGKCGTMAINTEKKFTFKIQKNFVPIVERYTYLGLIFNDKWESSETINNNKKKTEKAFFGAYSFLKNNRGYGGELFGMSEIRSKKIQTCGTGKSNSEMADTENMDCRFNFKSNVKQIQHLGYGDKKMDEKIYWVGQNSEKRTIRTILS